jgi:hypothetical protein
MKTVFGRLALLVVALLAIAGGARADRIEATLTYRAAASSCPAEGRFRELVTVRLGYDPFVASAPAQVDVELAQESADTRGTVVLIHDGQRKARTLTGASCAAVAEALATTLALALDPLSAMRPPERSELLGVDAPLQPAEEHPQPELGPPIVPSEQQPSGSRLLGRPDLAPPTSRALPDRSRWHREAELAGGAFASAAEGFLPGVALGGGIAGALSRRHLYVALDVRFVGTPGGITSTGDHVHARLLSGGLSTCARFGSFVLCGVARGGQLWSRADDVREPRIERRAVASVGPAIGFLIHVAPRTRLMLGLEISTPLTDTRLRLADDESEWEAPPAAIAASVGGVFGLR